MNIFNKGFIKTLTSKGTEYYETLNTYKSELKDQEFFENLGRKKMTIRSMTLFNGYGKNIEEFGESYDFIRINYEIEKDNYCGGTRQSEFSIDLPQWILEDRDIFKRKLSEVLKWHKENKRNFDEIRKRDNLKTLNKLAKELGYTLEKEQK